MRRTPIQATSTGRPTGCRSSCRRPASTAPRSSARRHLAAGAKRVVLASTPEDPADMETVIMGVNDEVLGTGRPDRRPRLEHLQRRRSHPQGARRGFRCRCGRCSPWCTPSPTTPAWPTSPATTCGCSRSGAENIIPRPTNFARDRGAVLARSKGKISGLALNVPVQDGSNVDLVAFLATPTDAEINAHIAAVARGSRCSPTPRSPIVSSDVIGSPTRPRWTACPRCW